VALHAEVQINPTSDAYDEILVVMQAFAHKDYELRRLA
jgi:hypothetical protein